MIDFYQSEVHQCNKKAALAELNQERNMQYVITKTIVNFFFLENVNNSNKIHISTKIFRSKSIQ